MNLRVAYGIADKFVRLSNLENLDLLVVVTR